MAFLAQFAALALQCSMCYQNASAAGARGAAALNLGILILILPPVAIIGGISWLVYQRQEGGRDRTEPSVPAGLTTDSSQP